MTSNAGSRDMFESADEINPSEDVVSVNVLNQGKNVVNQRIAR